MSSSSRLWIFKYLKNHPTQTKHGMKAWLQSTECLMRCEGFTDWHSCVIQLPLTWHLVIFQSYFSWLNGKSSSCESSMVTIRTNDYFFLILLFIHKSDIISIMFNTKLNVTCWNKCIWWLISSWSDLSCKFSNLSLESIITVFNRNGNFLYFV